MMNRGLMRRQMFAMGGPVQTQMGGLASLPQINSFPAMGMAKGGAAFPDLTGDGQVTQADILKGRGVQLAMGGEPMMAQQATMMQAPMPQAPMPQDPSMDQAMAQAAQVGVDPAAVEGMLSQVSEGIGNLDDAEDFEQVMNSMRGDEAPISERYAELAEVVGEEDAQATPESVLALVQPVMQIAQVDQGIGGLAQEEMSAPVEGNMAGGIMSTVNMGEEVPAPVNFNQGGPVVAMAPGGVVGRAATMQPGFRDLYASVLGDPAERQAEFDEQKRLTQAQMLFDIANTALAFATPGERQMSPAERLASVTQETQLFDKIGARSQSLQDLKTKQKEAERQLDLAALDASVREASAAEREAAAIKLAEAKKKETTIKGVPLSVFQTLTEDEQQRLILGDPSGVNGIPRDIFDKLTDEDKKLVLGTTQLPGDVKGIPAAVFDKLTKEQKERVLLGDPLGVNGVPRDIFDTLTQENKNKVLGIADGPVKGIPRALFDKLSEDERNRVLVGDPQGVNGIPRDIFDKLPEAEQKTILGTAPESVKGVPRDIYDSLTQDSKDMLLGISLDVKGVPASIYNKLEEEDQKKLLGIVPVVADKYKLEEIQTDEGIKLFVFNETDGTRTLAETFDPVATGALVKFRITNSDGTVTEAVELLNSKAGKELQKKVNAAKKIDPQSASIVKVGTEQVNPQAYLTIDGEVVTSFDNRTFFNPKTNKVMSLSDPSVQAQALGDADVYEIIKKQNILNYGKKRLEELTKDLNTFTYTDLDGVPLDQGQQDALRELERTTLKAIYGEITEQDVKRGTGLISNIFAAANAVGGTFAPEFFSKVFKNTEQARLNLGLFNLMAVSALAVNPRLAVYDIQRVEKILPKPTRLLTNPASEAEMFQKLVRTMELQRARLLEAIRMGDAAALDNLSGTMKKVKELDNILQMVRISPDPANMTLEEAMTKTESKYE